MLFFALETKMCEKKHFLKMDPGWYPIIVWKTKTASCLGWHRCYLLKLEVNNCQAISLECTPLLDLLLWLILRLSEMKFGIRICKKIVSLFACKYIVRVYLFACWSFGDDCSLFNWCELHTRLIQLLTYCEFTWFMEQWFNIYS